MAASPDDQVRLLVSIEATQKQFAKQLAAVAKSAGDTATGIEGKFKKANDNIGGAFQRQSRAATASMRQSSAAVSNLSFQLNDIAMGLASGTSPFTIMVQQGSQVAQVFNGSGGGLVGAIKTLGGAFATMVNPVSLASFALIGLAGYAVQYFTSVDDGADKSGKALKEHKALISSVAKEWGDAVPWVKAYAEAIEQAESAADIRAVTQTRIEDIFKDAKVQVSDLNITLVDVVSQLRAAGAEEDSILRIQDAFNRVSDAVNNNRDSTKETKDLTSELINAWLNTGVSGAQSFAGSIHKIADAFAQYAKNAEEAKRQSEDAIRLRALEKMNDPSTWRSAGRGDSQSPDGSFGGTGTFLPDNGPTPGSRPLVELEGLGDTVKTVKDSFDGLDGAVKRYVDQIVKAESGGNASAKNPLSSATGLGQFISSTWLTLFKKNFPDRAQGMADATILALRNDADISRTLIEAYARENADILRQAGVSVNEAALHLAHFLGPGGAVSVLKAAPGTPVSGVLSQGAINANPTILGGGATVDDVIRYAEGRAGAYDKMRESAKALKTEQKELNAVSNEFASFGEQLVGGFISDLRNGVSAADALKNALNQVLDTVIQIGLKSLFGGAGGGGGLMSLFGFADGGIASKGRPQPLKTFARGGVSRSAAIFGEAGPEAAVPLPDGRSIPVTLKAPSLPGRGQGGGSSSYAPTYNIDARGADQAAVARLERGLEERDRTEGKRVAGYNQKSQSRKVRP